MLRGALAALLELEPDICVIAQAANGREAQRLARDFTPEATRAVLEKELPGFGEVMRMNSYAKVKTAILSRATAGIRGRSLIINLPGRPTAVAECLPLLLPAIAEALDHVAGFRPKLNS